MMNEDFLHFLWKYQLFTKELQTVKGEKITVIHTGWHNQNAGPDFTTAKVKIGNTIWAGNVEIHIKTSDWLKHGHQYDKAYQNIILHVVYEHDETLDDKFPTMVIADFVDKKLVEKYNELITYKRKILCESFLHEVDSFTWTTWKNTLIVERMEEKYQHIKLLLDKHVNNWEEVFYILMAKNFGFKVNSIPFEMLAKSLPLKYVAKIKNNILDVEALLFGQAGLLNNDFSDEYPNNLKKRYQHLKNMWNLSPIDEQLWRFLRLRPPNFPHIRLAQFAQLIHRSKSLFSHTREAQNIEEITHLLYCEASTYWETHYIFDKSSVKKSKILGEHSAHLIMINTIAPILFAYGTYHQNEDMKEKAIDLFYKIPHEKNQIINRWKKLSIQVENAADSQALIHLNNEYCVRKNCLKCAIGTKILNSDN